MKKIIVLLTLPFLFSCQLSVYKMEKLINEGYTQQELNEYENALEKYNEALKIDDTYSKTYAYKCSLYTEIGEYDEAKKNCEKAISLKKDFALAYNYLGVLYQRLGKYEDSIKEFDLSISFDDKLFNPYGNKCYSEARLKKYDEALKNCDKSLELNKQNHIAYTNKGFIYDALNNKEDSAKMYKEAMELNPGYDMIYEFKCENHLNKKNYKEALKECDLAIENNYYSFLAYINKGIAYYKLQEFQNAINIFDEVNKISPSNYKANKYKGYVLYKNGYKKEAKEAFKIYNDGVYLPKKERDTIIKELDK